MTGFPDRSYFERVGGQAGFGPGPLETVFRLTHLLEALAMELGHELLLRGGTALNLLHLDIPRLSVDLDLDFVGTVDAEETRARRPALIEHVLDVCRRAGYAVVEERPSYAMAHVRLSYVDTTGRTAFIKLDLNFLDRVPVLPPIQMPINHPRAVTPSRLSRADPDQPRAALAPSQRGRGVGRALRGTFAGASDYNLRSVTPPRALDSLTDVKPLS